MPSGLRVPNGPSGAEECGVLRNALTALGQSGVTAALTAGDLSLPGCRQAANALVLPSDLAAAERTLRARAWIPAPASWRQGHRSFITYECSSGRWYQLNFITRVDAGAREVRSADLVAACLTRARGEPSERILHPNDAFWLTFIDLAWKEAEATGRETLVRLASSAGCTGPVAEMVGACLPDGTAGLRKALAAARNGDWGEVEAAHRSMRSDCRNGRIRGKGPTGIVDRIRGRTWLAPHPGLSVAFLGLDGAGKTTISSRLDAEIPWPTVSLYMGVWRESSLDRLVRRVLGAQLVLRLGRLSRIALLTKFHRAMGRVVLLDRFVVDANLPSPDLDWRGKVSAALVLRTAAAPDRFIFLDAPPEVVYARKGELTIDELAHRRESYRSLQDKFPQMVTVEADQPLDDVLRAVSEVLWADLVRLSSGASEERGISE
jgi:thymidylate kinase